MPKYNNNGKNDVATTDTTKYSCQGYRRSMPIIKEIPPPPPKREFPGILSSMKIPQARLKGGLLIFLSQGKALLSRTGSRSSWDEDL